MARGNMIRRSPASSARRTRARRASGCPAGQHGQQGLALDGLDDEPALVERQAHEADLDAAVAQRLGLRALQQRVEADLDGREPGVPDPQHARQDVQVGRRREADVELPDLAAAGALRRAHRALGLREYLPHLVGERLPRGRDLDAPLRAMEERESQLLLELADLLAERRLRDAEAAGGAPEVQLLRHGEEVAQVAELHAARIHTPHVSVAPRQSIGPTGESMPT